MLLLAALSCPPAHPMEPAALALPPSALALPPSTLALPPFELIDEMHEFSTEAARREDRRRIDLASAELAKELQRRNLYRVVEGKTAAERVARCWVQKVSNLILNLNIEVSTEKGETVYMTSVDIRGNTDEAWLRGVRRLVDNIEARSYHLR
jgi:hypothetical protein